MHRQASIRSHRMGGMEDVIVQRRFELRGSLEVIIRFSRPVPDGKDFRCRYEIVWPDRTDASNGFGVDEMQALILAIEKAHIELLASIEGRRGELTWLGQRNLGLPLSDSVSPDDFK